MINSPILLRPLFLTLISAITLQAAPKSNENSLDYIRQTYIPKRETQVTDFLQEHPTYDGRGIVMAIFDTGVDPAVADLQTTTTGKQKVIDIIDASGSGDVDTSTVVKLSDAGTLDGLTGRTLTLPDSISNPSGDFFIGRKQATELFRQGVVERIQAIRKQAWETRHAAEFALRIKTNEEARKDGERKFEDKAESDLTREERNILATEAALKALEDNYLSNDLGPIYDCVVWNDGEHFHAIVDTDEDGDLAEETILRPFGVAYEYAWFEKQVASNFGIQVYEDGKVLSIVTNAGDHATHVASIAAGHDPSDPSRNGIAPGVQIISIKIGDVRIGGGSTGFASIRATAACARFGVDLINVSWGGSSRYMDGTDEFAQAYKKLTRDYGITCIMSAGNSGPALTSLGSPGGELPEVIGVGAYVSKDMGKYLYALAKDNPDTAYGFSSTGPSKGGDLGVDIMAPGGALASVTTDMLQGHQLMNGTSMAAPSTAGAVALIMSGAKQESIPYNPYSIRAALTNSAKYIDTVEPWTQGAGLIQTPAAFKHLKNNPSNTAFKTHYNIKVTGNSLADGPGVYIRTTDTVPEDNFTIRVTPNFLSSATPQDKIDYTQELVLKSSADWVTIPKFLYLTSGGELFRPLIKDPSSSNSEKSEIFYAKIEAFLANDQDAGPVFTVPITWIKAPSLIAGEKTSYTRQLETGISERSFFGIPTESEFMDFTFKRVDKQEDSKLYMITMVSLDSTNNYSQDTHAYFIRLRPNEEKTYRINVLPNQVAEFNLQQYWSSPGHSELEITLEPKAIFSKSNGLVFAPNQKTSGIKVTQQNKNFAGTVSAKLKNAHYTYLPSKAELTPLRDREQYPPLPFTENPVFPYELKLLYEVNFEEPIELEPTGLSITGFNEAFVGGMFKITHESGKILGQGYQGSIHFPKGKSFIEVSINSHDNVRLEGLKQIPFQLSKESSAPMTVYLSDKDRVASKPSSTLKLTKDHEYILYVDAPDSEKLHEIKPLPDTFTGIFNISDDGGNVINLPISYILGKKAPEKDKKSEEDEDERSPDEILTDTLFEQIFKFASNYTSSDDKAEQSEFDKSIERLKTLKPKDASVLILQSKALVHRSGILEKEEETAEKPSEPVDRNSLISKASIKLKEALVLSKSAEVAQFLGAPEKPLEGDKEAEKTFAKLSEEMNTHKTNLIDNAVLTARILLAKDMLDETEAAINEAKRWAKEDTDETKDLSYDLLLARKLYGLALDALNTKLKEDSTNKALLQKRIDLYKKLNWHTFATAEELRLKLHESQPIPKI